MLTTQRHSVARTYFVCSAQCTQEQPVEYCLSACHCDCISFITNSIFCTWSYYQIEFIGRLFCRQHDSIRQQRWYGIQYISFRSLSAFPIFRGIVFGTSNALLSLSVYVWNFGRYYSNDRTADSTESFDNLVLCQFERREMCRAACSCTMVTTKQVTTQHTTASNLNKSNLAVAANIRALIRTASSHRIYGIFVYIFVWWLPFSQMQKIMSIEIRATNGVTLLNSFFFERPENDCRKENRDFSTKFYWSF